MSKKISELGAASALTGTELVEVVQSSTSKRTTAQAIANLAIVSDGDKGDITVSGSGGTWAIDNDAVTYAKMQNVSAASKLLGRGDGGAGDPQEITLGTNLTMSGTTLNAGGGITNSAASNELMKSDGTNAVASGVFVPTTANVFLGTGLSGSSRTIESDGSASDVGLNIYTKGSGNIDLFPNEDNALGLRIEGSSGNIIIAGGSSSGSQVLNVGLVNTEPTQVANQISIYGVDDASETTLGLFTEKDVAADVAVASTHSLIVKINGTLYKILLATP